MWQWLNRRWTVFWAYLIFVAGTALVVLWVAEGRALDMLKAGGQADLALASDSLRSELEQYRSLAVVVAAHPQVAAVLDAGSVVGQADFLLELADKTGSLNIAVVDRRGVTLASSSGAVDAQVAGRPYFERAMDGAMGVYHMVSQRFDRRVFLHAAPVFSPRGPVEGAVIVSTDIAAVEANWRGDRPTVFFTDELGVIFVSSRSELVLRSRSGDVTAAGQSVEYAAGDVAALRPVREVNWRGHRLWQMDGGRYLPDRGMHLTRELPVIGLVGEALLDTRPARALAWLQAAFAGAFLLAFGAVLFWVTERRRVLAEANARLEARVADRTAELRALNTDLQREVAERREAQAALTQAQADLVQAGKLSALGQMSAGISHELNQPLMAIRSFAENGAAFLGQDKPEVAAQNFGRISELARRMGRIIKNLRAFARQEGEAIRPVDLGAAVADVIDMVRGRLQETDVALHWQAPAAPVIVRGGDVRLQQVVLNLVTNAIDAMAGAAERALYIDIAGDGDKVALTVRDTGPGLADPEKVFEPFYSTKQLPNAEGMGLGLSISYGLVQSFGGEIRGRNHAEGGAEFTVTLDRAQAQEAA